jgi:hypothetical protein
VKPPLLVKPVTNWNEHMSMFVEEPEVSECIEFPLRESPFKGAEVPDGRIEMERELPRKERSCWMTMRISPKRVWLTGSVIRREGACSTSLWSGEAREGEGGGGGRDARGHGAVEPELRAVLEDLQRRTAA